MLITLRNSGAETIQYTVVLENEFKLKIVEDADKDNHHGYELFLKSENLDSFVLDKDDIHMLHMSVDSHGWGNNATNHYAIHLETKSKRHYRLHYKSEQGKPDFFKKLFSYFYPDEADNQVEELV